MTEEGRISRALSKGGDGGPPERPSEPESVSRAETAGQAAPAQAGNRFGEPRENVVLYHDKFGEVASQVRALRARLLSARGERSPSVITISSGTREEGKSTLAANLAVALAELDDGRVVLVDGDLAGPALDLVMNVQRAGGLNEILKNGLTLADNVYKTAVEGLDLIPSHAVAEDGNIEGLLAKRCGQLFGELKKHYRYIVIDTPPVLAGSETCAFGRKSDGVLMVARLESTSREVVKRAVDELKHSDVRILGCVLTHRKHHVPNFIYRFFGSTPHYYYSYRRSSEREGAPETGEPEGEEQPSAS